MKKLTDYIVTFLIYIFITLNLCSCIDGERNIKYYKFENESNITLKLKFYSNYKLLGGFDSLIIEDGSYSNEFYESSGVPAQDFFIYNVDSIDFISNEVLMKRYRKSDGIETKTPFAQKYFDKQVIEDKNKTINIYTILANDFK